MKPVDNLKEKTKVKVGVAGATIATLICWIYVVIYGARLAIFINEDKPCAVLLENGETEDVQPEFAFVLISGVVVYLVQSFALILSCFQGCKWEVSVANSII